MFIKKYLFITITFGLVLADFPYPPALEIDSHYGGIPSNNVKEYPMRSATATPPLSFGSASESSSGSASTSGSSSASALGIESGSSSSSSSTGSESSSHDSNKSNSHGDYKFKYAVHVKETADIKRHHESRQGNVVKGSYELIQPDGIKRIVHYIADENGFNADVNYNDAAKADNLSFNSDSQGTNNGNNGNNGKSRKIRQIINSRPIALTTSPRTPRRT